MRLTILHALPVVLALGCGAADEGAVNSPATTPTRTEVEIPVAQLPSAIIAALAGKGDIREAEMIVSQRGTVYEVEIGNTEYMLDASGTILAQEQDDEDEDADDEESDSDSDSDSDEAEGDSD